MQRRKHSFVGIQLVKVLSLWLYVEDKLIPTTPDHPNNNEEQRSMILAHIFIPREIVNSLRSVAIKILHPNN
jgi:hypothetical protein